MSTSCSAPKLADILREGFGDYLRQFGPFPKQHYDVTNAITRCRTEALGSHLYQCGSCGHEVALHNSCRNRHCPQCQALRSAFWAQKRMEEVLPTRYFHVVFTVPCQLNAYALRNQKTFYAILFKAVSETLLQLGRDDERLGGLIGAICVLHTWGQTLMDHPHIHCIVPGGGLVDARSRWEPSKKDFLFPVAVMRKMFRGKFMSYFREALKSGEISCLPVQPQSIEPLITTLYTIPWVVYVKRPFASPRAVINYLSAYTHRVAISNSRIIKLEDGKVSFRYKDYADNKRAKTMTLTAVEFIRRFMMHVLPKGFMRIRYYGFFGNSVKKKLLPIISELCLKAMRRTDAFLDTFLKEATRISGTVRKLCCPACGKGTLANMGAIARGENVAAFGGID
jgi:hypothetical protein